jgi:hypothetical protein
MLIIFLPVIDKLVEISKSISINTSDIAACLAGFALQFGRLFVSLSRDVQIVNTEMIVTVENVFELVRDKLKSVPENYAKIKNQTT